MCIPGFPIKLPSSSHWPPHAVHFLVLPPHITYLITSYSSQLIPNNHQPNIHVSVLPTIESVLFSPNILNLLTRFTHPILDVIAWLPYGVGHLSDLTPPFIIAKSHSPSCYHTSPLVWDGHLSRQALNVFTQAMHATLRNLGKTPVVWEGERYLHPTRMPLCLAITFSYPFLPNGPLTTASLTGMHANGATHMDKAMDGTRLGVINSTQDGVMDSTPLGMIGDAQDNAIDSAQDATMDGTMDGAMDSTQDGVMDDAMDDVMDVTTIFSLTLSASPVSPSSFHHRLLPLSQSVHSSQTTLTSSSSSRW